MMADTQMMERSDRSLAGAEAIQGFAARVLDVLVARSRKTAAPLREDLVLALSEGVVTQDEALIDRTLAEFRRGCISPVAMADLYIPAAARLLGTQWTCDTMSFAEVTIASARLQAMVRAICTRWGTDFPTSAGRRSVLMVVPQGEDHTLGAVVATGQMRRMGISVCLRLRPAPGEVAELLRTRNFDAAMISMAQTEKLEGCRKLVGTMRKHGASTLPVVVGGAIVPSDRDLLSLTGADLVSGDPAEALGFCGLMQPAEAAVRRVGPVAQLHG
jgi:MerR family transcriptional regulator, light-induced transcriptional regulator